MGAFTVLHGVGSTLFSIRAMTPRPCASVLFMGPLASLIEWVVGWDVLVAVQACMRFRIGNRGVVWCMSESR